jgi:hypothetical protein
MWPLKPQRTSLMPYYIRNRKAYFVKVGDEQTIALKRLANIFKAPNNENQKL